jgi:spore coat protein CotH
VINEITAETVMLQQDRCTKNYYVFHSKRTDEWMLLPWDNEDAFATDYRYGMRAN